MKRKLGISIYPEKSTVEKDKEYIEKAHKYGFSKIFTCLLSVDKPIDIIKKEFTEIKQKMKKASARTSRAKACFHGTTLI